MPEIKRALEVLTSLGLIYYDAQRNKYHQSSRDIDTGPEARGVAFTSYHQQMIEKAKHAVTTIDKQEREISCVTIQLAQNDILSLKQKIQTWVREVNQMEKAEPATRIVQFNIQMFPFSHTIQGKKDRS